jgi:O-antigen ligase
MIGVDETYSNPNGFAATIVYSITMSFPFWSERGPKRHKALLAVYTCLSAACVGLTGSRSGMVGLVCAGLLLGLLSKRRKTVLPMLLLCAPVAWMLLPGDLQNRFLTLLDPSYGPANAQESAEGRIRGLVEGLNLWGEHPLTGAGPGVFAVASGLGAQAHNLYGQIVGELGTLGALAFFFVLWGFVGNALEIRSIFKGHADSTPDFVRQVNKAIIVAVVLLLILGYSGHNLYRYTWMWFGAFQSVALQVARQRNAFN